MLLKNEMVEIRFVGPDICFVSIRHRNKDNTVFETTPGDPSGASAQITYEDLGPYVRKWIDPILEGMRDEDGKKPEPEFPASWSDNPAGWMKFKDELDQLDAQALAMAGLVRKDGAA